MGSLSNLYISSSFQSLLHFGSNNTASVTLTQIEDGFGNGLGLYLNSIGSASLNGDLTVGGDFIVSGAFDIEGKVTVNDNVRVNGNLEVSGATTLTGSLVVSNAITASNMFISNNLSVSGTINAYEIITTIESSSVIFSSGSNILGDSTSDTQTLNGTIIMSGSSSLTGSMGITGNLNVLGAISSSTINGIGNVTTFSQSVDARLDIVEATASLYIPFSTSVDSRLDYLEGPFSSSVSQEIKTLQLFTASVGLVTTASFQAFTASTNQRLNSLEVASSSLQSFSSSALISIANLNTTTASLNTSVTNLNASSASQQISINAFNAVSGGLATTGSNIFVGNQVFSGSMRGVVVPLTITSLTASIDCSLGNFFSLALPGGGVNTRLVATNIQPGETINLKVLVNSTTSSVSYPTYFKFPSGNLYSASFIPNAVDIVSLISYDTTTLYGVNVKNMI
jgi:cytoskeletal protein CcmA (bactofilin family)